MKLSLDLGQWTATKAALAVAGALAIVGAVGTAVAMSPIVQPPIKWAGGAEFGTSVFVSSDPRAIYTVLSGRNLIVTDLVFGNPSDSAATVNVYSGDDPPTFGICFSAVQRVHSLVVSPRSSAALSLQTGIGFASGKSVCLTASISVSVSGRGFLFTAAPAS